MLAPEVGASPSISDTLNSKNAVVSFIQTFARSWSTTAGKTAEQKSKVTKPAHKRPAGYNKYSYAEIAQHNTPEDAWVIIDNKVYDVTGMNHPGGPVLFSQAGRDATEVFHVMHKNQDKTQIMMKHYLIGEVDVPEQTALLRDWNAMREGFERAGYMTADPLYYIRKILELVALASASVSISYMFPNVLGAILASFCMATFFYQVGWTQHDFQHNQVFRSHRMNAIVGGLVVSVGMGGSAHWWKTKHNQHHATPNKMDEHTKTAVDPDIDTVPLIAWSETLMKQVHMSDRGIIAVQHVIMWPLLLLALVNWQIQGIIHLLTFPTVTPKTRRNELTMIAIHHAWVLAASVIPLGFKLGLLHWCLSHALGGFVTAFVFVQSHNAMEIYTDDKDFVTSQMVSTRNINPGLIADWIMGGLNYQIEHHLFPTMPRHSFSKVRKDIMQFCARHGLPYESCSIWESTAKVYKQLAHVAKLT